MRIKLLLSFFFLIGSGGYLVSAQENIVPKDSVDFWKFIMLQKNIPGLGYSWKVEGSDIQNQVDSLESFEFVKTDTGYFSKVFEDFDLISMQESELIGKNLNSSLGFVVFTSPSTLSVTQEYVANLIRNGDFQPLFEEKDLTEDLVSLAQKEPYSPLLKFKLLFISDFKLFFVTWVIVFFFIVSIGMIIFMIILKLKKTTRDNLLKEYENRIVDPLTSLLFEKDLEEISEMNSVDFYDYFAKDDLSNHLFKEVLVDNILSLNKKMKGEFKGKLKLIYQKLGLDKFSLSMLESPKWHKVTEALVQINEMDLLEALPRVEKHANSENFYVRSQAVATLLNLSQKADLTFLRDQTFPLSEWQQMNYLRIIKFVNNYKPLSIEVLFQSQNPTIRIFGVRLIRMLGRVDLIGHLNGVCKTASEEERLEILETFEVLGAHMEIYFINNCLQSESEKVAFYAAKAAASLGDTDSVEIIFKRLSSGQHSFKLKKQLLRALYSLDKSRFDQITLGKVDPTTVQLRAHILDPMLSYV